MNNSRQKCCEPFHIPKKILTKNFFSQNLFEQKSCVWPNTFHLIYIFSTKYFQSNSKYFRDKIFLGLKISNKDVSGQKKKNSPKNFQAKNLFLTIFFQNNFFSDQNCFPPKKIFDKNLNSNFFDKKSFKQFYFLNKKFFRMKNFCYEIQFRTNFF